MGGAPPDLIMEEQKKVLEERLQKERVREDGDT